MRTISRTIADLSLAAAGAATMYLFDPARGRQRRARLRELARHELGAWNLGLGAAARDLDNRAHGVVASLRSLRTLEEDDLADEVVIARVRSRLGHVCAHPHAIDVSCQNGVVDLRGPILEQNVPAVLAVAHGTLGVKEVRDAMERHATSGNVPALQGAPRVPQFARARWSPASRLVVGSVGGGIVLFGLARRGFFGLGALVLGGLAVVRSVANVSLRELSGLGGRPAVDIVKTVTIHAPVQEVAELFAAPESFPKFMRHVKEVRRLGDNRWHWSVVGPGGIPYEWDGYLARHEPNELVAWRSEEGASVANEGSVVFETVAPGQTRVTIRLRYWPPGGLLGHEVARLFGDDPKHELDCDMMRLKSLLELGKTTGPGGTTRWDDLRPASS